MSQLHDNSHTRNAFIRQRRNLMAVSVALAFLVLGEVNLPSINILGNVFIIPHPQAVRWFGWLLWGYWLLRYLQYLLALDSAKAVVRVADQRYRGMAYARCQQHAFSELIPRSPLGEGWKYDIVQIELREPAIPDLFIARAAHGTSPDGTMRATPEVNFEVTLSRREKLFFRCLSYWHAAFLSTAFTEFTLPWVVSLAPIFAWVFTRASLDARCVGCLFP